MTVTVSDGNEKKEYSINEEVLVSSFLKREGISFSLPCGGNGKCLNCRVCVRGELSEVTVIEKQNLSREELDSGIRLACFTKILGDAEIITEDRKDSVMTSFGSGMLFEKDLGMTGLGVAFDIGTTTVCGYLFDLSTGKMLDKAGEKNSQTLIGSDVISRIEYSLAGGAEKLKSLISDQINGMIVKMCENSRTNRENIVKAVITGNTSMLYFLTGRSPASIARAPFEADTLFGDCFTKEITIPALKNAWVYLPRCMGAYVGGDITCSVLSTGLWGKKGNVLLADIGTNGEIVLCRDGKLTACSTAAGPAFEGAELSCGVTAMQGAVTHVKMEKGILVAEQFDGGKPVGFCGSGIIDALAWMLKLEIVDETGRITEDRDSATVCGIDISQRDIRNIQSGKAAICAGIKTLIESGDLREGEISEVIIAGGFGSFIDVKNGETIGLIPKGFADRARAVGNASALGAIEILLSDEAKKKSVEIGNNAEILELTVNPLFSEKYIDEMMF